jgi:hypothetical protein
MRYAVNRRTTIRGAGVIGPTRSVARMLTPASP